MAGTVSAVVATVRQRGIASLGRCSLPLLSAAQPPALPQSFEQRRGIVSKDLREPGYTRPAPFPYREKTYNMWQALFDDTTQRFDENSKILVVDGLPTGNKEKFAKEVADQLDMLYVPGAHLDASYVNAYGFDFRTVDDKLPFSCQSFDIDDFLRNPKHQHVARMQFEMMRIRFDQYMDALSHVLNTGQGVVMNRSLYSDHVFMDTLAECGFASKKARDYYYQCLEQGMVHFMRPHMVIYLDTPVDQVIKNVKARNKPEEVGSKFYTPEVLSVMEKYYKENYLKYMNEHCELLVYDWSEEGDPEVVVEDICRVNFEIHDQYDLKLKDWRMTKEWDWKEKRNMFSALQYKFRCWLDVPTLTVPEMVVSGEDYVIYDHYLRNAPGNNYSYGFNKDMGDSFLFKLKADVPPLKR